MISRKTNDLCLWCEAEVPKTKLFCATTSCNQQYSRKQKAPQLCSKCDQPMEQKKRTKKPVCMACQRYKAKQRVILKTRANKKLLSK